MTTQTCDLDRDGPPAVPGPARPTPTASEADRAADEAWRAVLSLHGDLDDDEWAALRRAARLGPDDPRR